MQVALNGRLCRKGAALKDIDSAQKPTAPTGIMGNCSSRRAVDVQDVRSLSQTRTNSLLHPLKTFRRRLIDFSLHRRPLTSPMPERLSPNTHWCVCAQHSEPCCQFRAVCRATCLPLLHWNIIVEKLLSQEPPSTHGDSHSSSGGAGTSLSRFGAMKISDFNMQPTKFLRSHCELRKNVSQPPMPIV